MNSELPTSSSTQSEQADIELKKLLAGYRFDHAVIASRDPVTRQLVSAGLLAAMSGRNTQQHQPARQAFLTHGYFEEVVRDLRTADSPGERAAAGRKLGLIGIPQGTSHLVAALQDSAPEVRRAAVESLGLIGDPAAVPALDELLQREDSKQLPESVILDAINSIGVTQANQSVVKTLPNQEEPMLQEVEARLPVEEEARFQMEAQTLRRAAEELARKRAEVQMARRFAESEPSNLVDENSAQAERTTEEEHLAVQLQQQRLTEAQRLRAEQEALADAAAELARRRSEIEETRNKGQEQARLLAEKQERIRAEEEAVQRQVAEELERIEAEAQRRLDEERRRLEEARLRAEEQRRLLEEDARRLAEEDQERLTALEDLRKKSEEESRIRADREQRIRAEIEALYRAEHEQRERIEVETKRRAELERNKEASLQAQPKDEEGQFSIIKDSSSVDVSNEKTETGDLETEKVLAAEGESLVSTMSQPVTPVETVHSERTVTEIRDDSGIPSELIHKLTSQQPSERAAALTDMARIGGDDAFHHICRAFDDQSTDVQNAAARALFGLHSDRAASFTRALREGSPERRRRIGAALDASGLAGDAISNLTGESREKTYDAFSLLFLMAKAGEVQPLMKAIEDYPNIEVRLAVVKLLALSGQPEIVPAFRRLAVRGSLPSEVRSAVMEAIYQISSQSPETAPSAA